MSLPKISLVTPSFNQGQFIEETIRSVLLQGYPNLEYIIMDGGSRDGTVEVIKKYEGKVSHWESEKDRGQSHAINKGLARCTGEIFNWINSDDLLLPGALWAVARAWMKAPGRIVSGHTEFFNTEGTFAVARARGQTLHNFVRFWETDGWEWAQQGTFLPLAELRAIGGVQEDLKYCMDYQMMVRLLMRGLQVTCVDQPLARFRFHGTSKTIGAKEEFRLERVPMLRAIKDLPVAVAPWEWDRQQARRLVDVSIGAAKGGKLARSCRLFAQSLCMSPVAVFQELAGRCGAKLGGAHN